MSRTFTPGASVSVRTREKIAEAVKILNYRPNLIARSLSTQRSGTVGVVVPQLDNQFYPSALEALSAAFSRYGHRVLLFTPRGNGSVEPVLEDVLNSRVDGLIMVATSISSKFAEECRRVGLPVVLFNRKTDSHLVSSVTGSNRKGAAQIADFLIAGRHKRFAYVAGLEKSSTNRDRETAFARRLAENGLSLSARVVGNYSFWESCEAARMLFRAKRPPDAVFCANDHMALAVINIARAEFGLQVGKDVSVVGFDDANLSSWPLFDLTTYVQPIDAMAEKVAEIIQDQLNKPKSRVSEIVLPGELIVRSSARLPGKGVSGPPERRIWRAPVKS